MQVMTDDVRRLCASTAKQFAVRPEVHEEDFIFRFVFNHPGFATKSDAIKYYFSDGANSARKVKLAAERWLPDSKAPLRILEFASGYGAVTRHLKSLLAPNSLSSSDIHPSANEFNHRHFGVTTIASQSVPERVVWDEKYDMIFVLSLFSHLPRATWLRWLQKLFSGLDEGGILLFTTHGKGSIKHFPSAVPDASGFWFEERSEQGDLDKKDYGQAVTLKTFVDAQIGALAGADYLSYEQGGWWGHQDVYVVRKPRGGVP